MTPPAGPEEVREREWAGSIRGFPMLMDCTVDETTGGCVSEHNALARAYVALQARVEEVRRKAKTMRKATQLVGPREYEHDPKAMKVWQKANYHAGKEIEELLRDSRLAKLEQERGRGEG